MGEDNHICRHESKLVLMEDHVKDIGRDTKNNNDIIFGNGKPGLLTRIGLVEQSIKSIAKFQWLNTAAILGAATKIMFFGG